MGWVKYDVEPGHRLFGKFVPCTCRDTAAAERLAKISRLSSDMLAWRFDGFKARKLDGFKNRSGLHDVTPQLRRALDVGTGWVTLSGPFGTGKTFLAAAMVNEARLRGLIAVYTTTADLLDDLRATFNPNRDKVEPTYSQLFHDVMNAQVLVLDEIEKFSTTPWAEEKFFQLIEHRYRIWPESLTMIVTNRRIGLDAQILPNTMYPGYLESRIMDGRFVQLDQFWNVSDARPSLRRATAA